MKIFYSFQNFICQSPKQFQLPSIPENVSNIINSLYIIYMYIENDQKVLK